MTLYLNRARSLKFWLKIGEMRQRFCVGDIFGPKCKACKFWTTAGFETENILYIQNGCTALSANLIVRWIEGFFSTAFSKNKNNKNKNLPRVLKAVQKRIFAFSFKTIVDQKNAEVAGKKLNTSTTARKRTMIYKEMQTNSKFLYTKKIWKIVWCFNKKPKTRERIKCSNISRFFVKNAC